MSKKIKFKSIIAISTLSLVASIMPANAAAGITYMEPVATGVSLDPFATAGDSINGYLIGGIPDGMGVIPVNGKLRVLTGMTTRAINLALFQQRQLVQLWLTSMAPKLIHT